MKKRVSKVMALSLVGVKTLKDTDDEKIVEVIDGNTVSTSTYNKKYDSLRLVTKKDGVIVQDEITKGIQNNDNTNNALKYYINMKSWTITNSKGSVDANSLWSATKHMKDADRYYDILY